MLLFFIPGVLNAVLPMESSSQINQTQPVRDGLVKGFSTGLFHGATAIVAGIANSVAHPVITVKGILNATIHPQRTVRAGSQAFLKECKVQGNAECIGRATFEVAALGFGPSLVTKFGLPAKLVGSKVVEGAELSVGSVPLLEKAVVPAVVADRALPSAGASTGSLPTAALAESQPGLLSRLSSILYNPEAARLLEGTEDLHVPGAFIFKPEIQAASAPQIAAAVVPEVVTPNVELAAALGLLRPNVDTIASTVQGLAIGGIVSKANKAQR